MFNYENLPDGMQHEEVRRCFTEFLFDYEDIVKEQKLYAFEQLFEIADRQTWELFDKPIIMAISDFILRYIDYEDFDIMETILGIIPRLGLTKVWETIFEKRYTIKNAEVVKLINESHKDYGDNVSDPYSGYK